MKFLLTLVFGFFLLSILGSSVDGESFNASAPSLVTHSKLEFASVIRTIVSFQGKIWYGTYGNGLFSVNSRNQIRNYTAENSDLLENRVNTLEVFKGKLWIGTCEGINVFDGRRRWQAITAGKNSVKANIYHSMRLSPDSKEIWVGMTGEGISVFNGTSWSGFGNDDGLLSGWVNDTAFMNGDQWAATFGGVYRKQKNDQQWKVATPSTYPVYKNTLSMAVVNGRDELWVATSERGVYCFQEEYWYHPPISLLPSPNVYWLAADSNDFLWIATDKGIVSMFPEDGWKTYKEDQGLEDPYTKVLYWDKKGQKLWAGSYNGVLSFFSEGRFKTIARDGKPAF
jgi:ligand-binding sensor domain-containing protein